MVYVISLSMFDKNYMLFHKLLPMAKTDAAKLAVTARKTRPFIINVEIYAKEVGCCCLM